LIVDADEEALAIALETIWNLPKIKPFIVIIRNTLRLDEMYVCKAIWEEIKDKSKIISEDNWKIMILIKKGI